MTYQEMLETALKLEGAVLKTITGREFTVGVYMDCPFFTPLSTGQGRSDGKLAAERFVKLYNDLHSLRPSDYRSVTRNASYFAALAEAFERGRKR